MNPLPPATPASARRSAIALPLPTAPDARPAQTASGSWTPPDAWGPHLLPLTGVPASTGTHAPGIAGWGPPSAAEDTQQEQHDIPRTDRFPPALHKLWTIDTRDEFIDSSYRFSLPALADYIEHHVNLNGLHLPASKVFALLDASAERTSRKQFVDLLMPLRSHVMRAFAEYETGRLPPPPGRQLDDWLPARSASIRLIGVMHRLPENQLGFWIHACAPVVARMHWAYAVEKIDGDTGGGLRILLRSLNSILQIPDAAQREHLLRLIAVGMASNLASSDIPPCIEPMKFSRVVCKLPTGRGGSAILTQLLLKAGIHSGVGIFLDASRKDDELFEVLMGLGMRRRASPLRHDRPFPDTAQRWPSQPGGTLVLYFGGLDPKDFYRYAGRVLDEFCGSDHDDCLEFALDRRFTGKHRDWLRDNAAGRALLEVRDTPTSLAYIRGRHQPWLSLPPTTIDDAVPALETIPAPPDFGASVSRR